MKTVTIRSRYSDRTWGKIRLPDEWAGIDPLVELEALRQQSRDPWATRLLRKVRNAVPEGDVPVLGF